MLKFKLFDQIIPTQKLHLYAGLTLFNTISH